jgi:hypothetical protein
MIDINTLNKFLDESNELIKNSKGLEDIAQCKPLCSFRIDFDGDSMTFAIEARGFIKDEIAFFLVAKHGMDDSSEFISRGYFTANEGHCASFAMSHDEPRGLTIQQGALIEMRNIVDRMNAENQSQFLEDVLKQLNNVKVKIQVVESDGDVLSRVDDAGLGEFKADDGVPDETIGKLELKPGKHLAEQQTEASHRSSDRQEQIEDIVDSEFAKTIGNKDEEPEYGNGIDDALKDTQVYHIEKKTFGQRIVATFRKMLGLDREREELDVVCAEMFDEKENE